MTRDNGKALRAKLLLVLGLGAITGSLQAAAPGDQVVVVYNRRVPESKMVADHYVQRRGVPPGQVLGLDTTTSEDITRSSFRDEVQQPLARWLEDKNLWQMGSQTVPATNGQPAQMLRRPNSSKIRYLVLCFGMPLRISAEQGLTEAGSEKLRPELRRDEAAVDSELALLPLFDDKPHLYGPLFNPYYAATNAALLNPTNGILMVSRLDGPSADIARGLVDKAIEAESNGLWGRAYFDLRSITDPGYRAGDESIRRASESAHSLGFETIVDTNSETFPASFPMSQIAYYAGWYDGNVSGPFSQPTVEFMPGAFAYHLHSFSAATIRSTNEHWVGPLLARGAAVTMGCVYEPYLSGTPDIGVFTGRFLALRFTFGEAAYASQPVLSWQTTVIGDPLYAPAAKDPKTQQDELAQRHSPLVEWSHLRWVNFILAQKAPLNEAVKYLEQLDLTPRSGVLTEKLGDLYVAQGKPSSAIWAYQNTLKLGLSPQQRVRVTLELANMLANAGRDTDALAAYESFLNDFPNYPDRAGIQQKTASLANKRRPPGLVPGTNTIK